jgi:hypothetical protein
MKTINQLICLFTAAILLVGCDNYLDVNEDPNNPLIENVAPNLLLAGAQTTTGSIFATRLNRLGGTLSGAWGGNVLTSADPFGQEFRYNINSTFFDDVWNNLYVRTSNYSIIANYEGEGDFGNHKAIAKIMRAFYFQILTDMYGDLPYFDKHQFTDLLQITYDDDTVIYEDLMNELNQAITLIDNNSDAISVSSEDAIFGGDMSLWKKFANTLKLKIVVRQSNVISQSDAVTALSGLTSADFLGFNEAVTLNPGYTKENDRQNPFYNSFGYSADGQTERNRTITASKYSIEVLDGTLSGVFDNRITTMFRTDNIGGYTGIEQGQTLGGLTSNDGLSLLGTAFGVEADSAINAQKDLYLFTVAESYFLQAEAAERNYLSGGDVQTSFNNGITASFNQFGILNGTIIGDYINDINSVNGFGLGGSANNIEAIITQKWIALHTFGGVEPWLEMTRTGFPNAPLPINQTNTQRPVKLLYPISEIQGNSQNVPSQQTSDAFINSIFWN